MHAIPAKVIFLGYAIVCVDAWVGWIKRERVSTVEGGNTTPFDSAQGMLFPPYLISCTFMMLCKTHK